MMIQLPKHLNLGLDEANIKKQDADRQMQTAKELIRRLFGSDVDCFHTQLLADEVGMGKTFVSLAVAYSLLYAMRKNPEDFPGLRHKIIVLTPRNDPLFEKWITEVREFLGRCIEDKDRENARPWFKAKAVTHFDELVYEIKRTGPSASIIVAKYSALGGRLDYQDMKQQLLVAALFRWWGAGLTLAKRTRILNASRKLWKEPPNLEKLDEQLGENNEQTKYLLTWKQFQTAFQHVNDRYMDQMKQRFEEISNIKSLSERDKKIEGLNHDLNELYRTCLSSALTLDIPLVIVDEAHNWKNHNNAYSRFVELLASHTRRLLLLTATPFQLGPDEMLKVMEVQKHLKVNKSSKEKYLSTFERLGDEHTKGSLIERSFSASERFIYSWLAISNNFTEEEILSAWKDRQKAININRELSEFIISAGDLMNSNKSVSRELRKFVIRHRRDTPHRIYLVGLEVEKGKPIITRSDSHLIHYERGLGFGDISPQVELAQYALMRAVAAAKKKGRTVIGTSLTGCFSILFKSKESKSLETRDTEAKFYVSILKEVIAPSGNRINDEDHPKIKTVEERTISSWARGEKGVIYSFRRHNADRLLEILRERVENDLAKRENTLFGDKQRSTQFRKRLSDKTDSLAEISFDRVLYTYHIYKKKEVPPLSEKVLRATAEYILRASVDFDKDKPDRLLLLRASESALAKELLKETAWKNDEIIKQIAKEAWIKSPYSSSSQELNLQDFSERQNEIADETSDKAEKKSGLFTRYRIDNPFSEAKVQEVLKWLKTSSILEQIIKGPNLWGPLDTNSIHFGTSMKLISRLWEITLSTNYAKINWRIRFSLIRLMRKAFLRRSFLLRVLSNDLSGEGRSPEKLVKLFYAPLGDMEESLANKFLAYMAEIMDKREVDTQQDMLLASLSINSPVTVVHGETKNKDRNRYFRGFNSPLLPEILVCTSVGQEGIDLHRFCKQVIHYDIPFNPATLEQRTGRIDRIGSKTFRDRDAFPNKEIFLEVDIPYMAATYDEKIFNDMRKRAQKFEILTGGDLASDVPMNENSQDDRGTESENDNISLGQLPEELLKDLRTDLAVYSPPTSATSESRSIPIGEPTAKRQSSQ